MIDAYDLHQEIFKAWQQLAYKPNAAHIKKNWAEVPVWVDGKPVTSIRVEDGKLILETT
jgi:hypothetical protein